MSKQSVKDEPYACPWCLKRFKTRLLCEKHEKECSKRPVKYVKDK